MKKDIYGVIYKITNKINNKSYIGQTTKSFKERYNNGEWWEYTTNMHLWNAYRKYGKENFYVIEKMDIAFSRRELDLKERFYINALESNNPKKGYNKTSGGGLSTSNIVVLNKNYQYIDTCAGYEEIIEKGYTKNISGILNVCKGRRGASYKHIFYYEEDLLEMKRKNIEEGDYRDFLFYKYASKKR